MNISDTDLIEILLTSEFEDIHRKEDFKFLLLKFRYFYRILHGKLGIKRGEIESIKMEFENRILKLESEINDLKIRNANLQNKIDLSPKPKKSIFRFFKSHN